MERFNTLHILSPSRKMARPQSINFEHRGAFSSECGEIREVWGSARRDKMSSGWACPRARSALSRERALPAVPTRKWRTTSSHYFDLRRAEEPGTGTRWRFRSAAVRTIFFVVPTVSVDGKDAWFVMSVDFDEALGFCAVRTNIVPVLCLRLGTPRRCCPGISRILSCNRLVPALFLHSLVPPLSPSLSRYSYHLWRLCVATGGETLFENVCLSASL